MCVCCMSVYECLEREREREERERAREREREREREFKCCEKKKRLSGRKEVC
jgi:hypothetical protein